MQVISLHLIDPDIVTEYVAALRGEPALASWDGWFQESLRLDLERALARDERAANRLTFGLAEALADSGPSYMGTASGLSFWEARVDRSIGMLMRPPSRLFVDAGLTSASISAMPIRIDQQLGMMGGAYIPARLIDQAASLFDTHLERSARRLVEAEFEPYAALALMHQAIHHAKERGLGLFEAQDLLGPSGETARNRTVIGADRKRLPADLKARIDLALTPPKKPGPFKRLLGHGDQSTSANGQATQYPESTNEQE